MEFVSQKKPSLWHERISASFDRAASSYDEVALVQQKASLLLMDEVKKLPLVDSRSTHIIELGAGTGFLSKKLVSAFPHASFTLIDSSEKMCEQLQKNFRKNPAVTVLQGDMEEVAVQKGSLVVSSFSLHWAKDMKRALRHGQSLLLPGGVFAALFPIKGSLQELFSLGCLFEYALFPEEEEVVSSLPDDVCLVEKKEIELYETYPSPFHFLSAMRSWGGAVSFHPSGSCLPGLLSLRKRKREPFQALWKLLLLVIGRENNDL